MSDSTLNMALRARVDSRMAETATKAAQSIVPPALFLIALVVLWAIGSAYGVVPNYLLPSPAAIANEFVNNSAVLLKHAAATTLEALSGFAIGSIAGLVAATALSFSPVLREAFYPYALISRAIPVHRLHPTRRRPPRTWAPADHRDRLVLGLFPDLSQHDARAERGRRRLSRDAAHALRNATAAAAARRFPGVDALPLRGPQGERLGRLHFGTGDRVDRRQCRPRLSGRRLRASTSSCP